MTGDLVPWLVGIGCAVLGGAIVGRWLNAVIDRAPRSESLAEQFASLKPRPRWWELDARFSPILDRLPFIGYARIARRGSLPRRYRVVEVLVAVMFGLLYAFEIPISGDPAAGSLWWLLAPEQIDPTFAAAPLFWMHLRFLLHAGLIAALVAATLVDFETYTIPDIITVPTMVYGVLFGTLLGRVWIVPAWFEEPSISLALSSMLPDAFGVFFLDGSRVPQWFVTSPHLHGLLHGVAGLIVGGGGVWLLRIVSYYGLGQEGLGFGDVTLMAAVGSVLGWQITLFCVLLAAVCGIIVACGSLGLLGGRYLAFGPYLSFAAFLCLLGWNPVFSIVAVSWYGWGPALVPFAVVGTVALLLVMLLVRVTKSALGIDNALAPWDDGEYWTGADLNVYLAQENVNEPRPIGSTDRWPGELAARGQTFEAQWLGTDD